MVKLNMPSPATAHLLRQLADAGYVVTIQRVDGDTVASWSGDGGITSE